MKHIIPYSDFRRLLADVHECETFESYIAEVGGSVPLEDADKIIRLLGLLWDMAHDGLTIKSIAKTCDISVRQIGIRYGIHRRTLEYWSSTDSAEQTWRLPLIAYAAYSDFWKDE